MVHPVLLHLCWIEPCAHVCVHMSALDLFKKAFLFCVLYAKNVPRETPVFSESFQCHLEICGGTHTHTHTRRHIHTHTCLILRKLKTTLLPRVRWVLNYCLSHQLCNHWKDGKNQMGAALCLCISAKQHLTPDRPRPHVEHAAASSYTFMFRKHTGCRSIAWPSRGQ